MKVISVDYENFKEIISQNSLVLAEFFTFWSPHSEKTHIIFNHLSEKFPDITFIKIDADRNPLLAQHFHITSVPSVFFWKDGKLKWKAIGVPLEKDLEKDLEDELNHS